MEDFVIENGVLKAYTGNESVIMIPEGVEVIDASFTCEAEVVVLPASLKKICHGAFSRYADFRGNYKNCELRYLRNNDGNSLVDIGDMYDCKFHRFDANESGRLERYIKSCMKRDKKCTRDHAIERYYEDHYNDDAWEYYNSKADEMLYDMIEDLNALFERNQEHEYLYLPEDLVDMLKEGNLEAYFED